MGHEQDRTICIDEFIRLPGENITEGVESLFKWYQSSSVKYTYKPFKLGFVAEYARIQGSDSFRRKQKQKPHVENLSRFCGFGLIFLTLPL